MDTEEKPHEDGGGDRREGATSPGMDAWSSQKLEEAGSTLPQSHWTELSLGTPRPFEDRLQDWGGWMSVAFSQSFGVLSYSRPRTLV